MNRSDENFQKPKEQKEKFIFTSDKSFLEVETDDVSMMIEMKSPIK